MSRADIINYTRNESEKLFARMEQEWGSDGTSILAVETYDAKENIREHFRKHPHWNEEQQAIILKSEYSRDFDRSRINKFLDWLNRKIDAICENSEMQKKFDKLCFLAMYWRDKWLEFKYKTDKTYTDLLNEGEAYTECLEIVYMKRNFNMKSYRGYYVTDKEIEKITSYDSLWNLCAKIADYQEQLVSSETLDIILSLFPEAKAVVGQKISKVVNALCVKLGIDKLDGYNKAFAQFADGVNPLKYETYTIISINELDYLTMSFGHNWASCQTIDQHNVRRNNGDHTYQGCRCTGTISYALDNATIIFYTVAADYDNSSEMWKADKVRRCNFHVSDNGETFIQGRVYPDARDGGEHGIEVQFRAIMQDIIATCYELPNLWTLKKGTEACENYAYSYGTHYRDYECYSDCNVSLNKGTEHHDSIYIGHDPICIVCGEEHDSEDSLQCDDCNEEMERCYNCDDSLNPNDEDSIRDACTGNWFCCERCAESYGVRYLEGEEEWSSTDDYFYDHYDDLAYYDRHEAVCTYDNEWRYSSEENAEYDGNVKAIDEYGDSVWVQEENAYEHSDGDYYTYEEEEEEEA